MALASNQLQALPTLRAITYRLTTAPPKQLPHIAAQVASQLWNCRELLSAPVASAKQGNDATATAHRFRSYLITLLQDRTVGGRWAAVVLVKATIEAGGVEVLSKSNTWIRSLLGILKKHDPPTTRSLAVLTLTRIFTLTWDYTNLVREITTPALPTFISACLSNIESQRCSASELQTVLQAFAALILRHPTIFRTNEAQIQSLLLRIISSSVSSEPDRYYTGQHRETAQRLLVLLHHCSPKQGASGKWDDTLKATVSAAHATCDRVFRSVVEDWQSTSGVHPSSSTNALLQGEAESEGDDAVGLSGWKGVFAGGERLVALLDLLESHVDTATASAVTVRIGLLTDVLTRVLSLRAPSSKHATVKANQQVSKDEREAVFTVLPGVHVAALKLIEALLRRFGDAIASVVQSLLIQVTWVFQTESADAALRTSTYGLLATVFKLHGPSLTKDDVANIESVIKDCCQDLLPARQAKNDSNAGVSTTGAAIGIQAPKTSQLLVTRVSTLQKAAESLLPLCFSNINPTCVSGRLRTVMERTAVVSQNKDALIACVLSPASGTNKSRAQPSLLPFLARQCGDSPEVEALLRPRMPVIRTGRTSAAQYEDEMEEDGDTVTNGHLDYAGGLGSQEDLEPTADLPSALEQQETAANDKDLYSASPEPQTKSAVAQSRGEDTPQSTLSAEKRTAEEGAEPDRSAKRLRASPVAETTLSNTAYSVHGISAVPTQANVPVTVANEQPDGSFVTAPEPSQQSVTFPAAVPQVAANTVADAGAVRDVGDDDSDFELPPLTMEPDTEDEEEEEEGQEEDGT